MKKSERFLRLPGVERKLGCKRTNIYAMEARGEFPKRIKIGRATVWLESEIDAWITERASARTSSRGAA